MDELGLKYLKEVDKTIIKHLSSNNSGSQEIYDQCNRALVEAVDDSRKVCDQILSSVAEARGKLEKLNGKPQDEKTVRAINDALNILIEIQAKAYTRAALPERWLK